ncbi:MAG: ArsR/SmtB family transcription factor [Anaerolineae bacterium]
MASPKDSAMCGADGERLERAREHFLGELPAQKVAETFRALADPTRARLISALVGSELCVGELGDLLGISISAVSHQLRLLRSLHIVRRRREGKFIFYALDDDHIYAMYGCALEHVRHS